MVDSLLKRKARRHLLSLYSPPATKTDRGQLTGSWTEDGTFYGTIRVLNGSELAAANKKYARATIEIETYADSSAPITTKKRFHFGSRIFEIGFVDDFVNQDGQKVKVLCSEVRDE